MKLKFSFVIILVFLLSGCATWHARTISFQSAVEEGNFDKARKELKAGRGYKKERNRLLYYLNLGYIEFMSGNYEESNRVFEEAERIIEEQSKNLALEAASILINPEVTPYKAEDFEIIMINVYKALNYLQLEKLESALVEVRRMNIKLNQLNDKYPEHKNRYRDDAFAHLMMGLIYDAGKDYNNAFIAYRNAYNTYQSDYAKNFEVPAPLQLKKDLLRTAYLCGFSAEQRKYEADFGIKYKHELPTEFGETVVLWLNGFGPVKSEWGITFAKEDRGGMVVFHNAEYGLSFPFIWSSNDKNSLTDLNVMRVVFPRYEERPLYYRNGLLSYNNVDYKFETAEDINQIAFKTLHDRMVREFSKSLLRFAMKQGIYQVVKKENEWVGLALNIFNAVTEKADTRGWQTLPYEVNYARVPLVERENDIEIKIRGGRDITTTKVQLPGEKGYTRFYVYTSF